VRDGTIASRYLPSANFPAGVVAPMSDAAVAASPAAVAIAGDAASAIKGLMGRKAKPASKPGMAKLKAGVKAGRLPSPQRMKSRGAPDIAEMER